MSSVKIIDHSKKIAADFHKQASVVVRKTAFDIEGTAKTLAPEDTGQLKGSIQAVDGENDLHMVVGASAAHAAFVEFGTGARGAASDIERPEGVSYTMEWAGMAAQPYLIPACEQHKESFLKAVKAIGK